MWQWGRVPMSNALSARVWDNLKTPQGLGLQVWTMLSSLGHLPRDSHQDCSNKQIIIMHANNETLYHVQLYMKGRPLLMSSS